MDIYDYKTKDGVLFALIGIGFFSFSFSLIDFVGAAFVLDKPLYYWYGVIFRLPIIVVYSVLAYKAYYYYRYLSLVFWLISLPVIIWSILIFAKTMNTWLFIITIILYIFIAWLFVDNALNKKFDFTKAAKQLLKDYPDPIIVKNNGILGHSEKLKRKDGGDTESKVLSYLFSIIPPWGLYAFPFIFVNIASQFMGLNGLAIGTASSGLFLCIMLSGYFSFHWRYKEVFERAEELLAEKNLTSKE